MCLIFHNETSVKSSVLGCQKDSINHNFVTSKLFSIIYIFSTHFREFHETLPMDIEFSIKSYL